MKGYADFIHYFRQLAAAHTDIKAFFVGNSDRILSAERSTIEYPVLWLEDPDVTVSDNGGLFVRYESSFVILCNAKLDDWQQQDYNLDKTYQIALEIIRKLKYDAEEGDCLFDLLLGSIRIQRIHTLTHDNDWGWRVDFAIQETEAACIDACKWGVDSCPIGAKAAFSWNNQTAGDFTNLIITNESEPEFHAWSYLWTWHFDEEAVQTSTEEVPVISGTGKWLYIRLLITDSNQCEREATAYFCNEKNCGRSVPYCYLPK